LHFVVGEKFMITGRRRHLEAVDALREAVVGGAKIDAPIDEIEVKRSTETNRNLYILTVLAAARMPPTFITGIFGMNVKGLLFTDDDNGFIYAMLMCLASAAAC
jgi:Mg2+ and Co2+ transporter CorA